MAEINIFNLQPNVVSRDLSGKSFLFYGQKKIGKTTNAAKFPKALLVAFEKGYSLIPGVIAQPVNKWTEALKIKKQLLADADDVARGNKKETMFKTIVVDTADIAYDLCEKYITDKEGVEYLDETESKRGYKATSREFDAFFQELAKAGYTIVIISHSDTVQIKDNGEKYDRTQPTVAKRGLQIISRFVDVIGYATSEVDSTGKVQAVLYMRGSKELEAGSRNKFMSAKIPFTYDALLADMQQAIDKLIEESGQGTDAPIEIYNDQSEELDFTTVFEEIKAIAMKLNAEGKFDKYNKLTEKHLGRGKTVKECTEAQVDILGLLLDDLKELCTKEGIEI